MFGLDGLEADVKRMVAENMDAVTERLDHIVALLEKIAEQGEQ